jgi:ABC-type Fe3+/spermidine/putrescine transport system ATPase subunit
MAYLELNGLTKRFRDHLALEGISLEVAEGELLCLLGPSGCGKSTTLRIIAGFETPDAGSVRLAGADIAGVPAQNRNIGMVFQSYALFPHLTVEENVGFGLKMRSRDAGEIAVAVAEALRLVRLAGVGQRLPRQISGGQQQRVALARALAIHPRLLLLDEPLSNLDARLRDEMREEIKRIQRSVGITAVFVTHDQHEALALADRVAVMDHGRIVQVDTPAALYERPAHTFVASFFGRANLISGIVVEAGSGGIRIRAANGLELLGRGEQLSIGAAVVGVIKYERLQLSRPPTPDRAGGLKGRVVSVTYLGTHVEYGVEVNGMRFGAVRSNEPGAERFAQGDAVQATFRPDDCLILRGTQA